MTVPILRAIMESGETLEDPSEDLLFMLLEHIERGDEEFLVLERTADATGQTYAQAARNQDGSWSVERREGAADRHFGTKLADLRQVHAVLTGWAFGLPEAVDAATWARTML
jgi:hypothetical protein